MLRDIKRVPRSAGVLVWTAGAIAMHAVVPHELLRLGARARPQGSAAPAARSAGLLMSAGRLGPLCARMLYRAVQTVAIARNFPPPDGHVRWDPDAAMDVAHDFLDG